MTDAILHFFYMSGYAWYVWGAYTSVFTFLLAQWFFPWRRWQKYLHTQKTLLSHE